MHLTFCKLIAMTFLLGIIPNKSLILNAQTKKSPATLGQPTYPSSGPTRNRSDVMGGASSASKASNIEGLIVPSTKPSINRQEQEETTDKSFMPGPYNQDGEYQYLPHND